jgi:hypothetical protein
MTDKDRALQYVLSKIKTDTHGVNNAIARCNRCDCIVLESEISGYNGQCMKCDEDLYQHEWYWSPIDTVNYEEFEELLKNVETGIF